MEEKQSHYEILGLTDKASPEDIQNAFEVSRRALESEPDGEEKRNRIVILQHARDLLNDRRHRAGYDRRRRDERRVLQAKAPEPWRMLWPALGLLILVAAYPAWRLIAPAKPATDATDARAAPVNARPATPKAPQASVSEDIAVLLPPAPSADAAPAVAPRAPLVPPQVPQKLLSNSPHAATLAKFSDSTYLIIGAEGLGTGVVIESDKLLTNCHVIAPNVLKGPIFAINPTTRERARITEAAFLITEDACVVHAPGLNGKPIAMGNAGQLTKGAPIFNIGFADGRLISSAGALLGVIDRGGQTYLVSSNYCDQGVSGGPLVDAEGRLVGLTSGGPPDRSFCLSLTAETARRVLSQTLIAIDAFPPNYLSNLRRRW
ncbi:MAG: trypsin-like peptidase domain-containing protein [Sulfuritalea sp.]|nr:trypsin-like peptidase domain-containing protein [Sulfuritalea sp.]